MGQYNNVAREKNNDKTPHIYAIVVSFNPNVNDLFNNLIQFNNSVEKTILVDNSDNRKIREEIKLRSKKFRNIYCLFLDNDGIGAAQNEAIRYINNNKRSNNTLLLFLDQDSYIEKNEVYKLYEHLICEKEKDDRVVMIGATTDFNSSQTGIEYTSHIISSGSMIELVDFNNIGYFDEELFIDFIDFAWCWKAIKLGYKIKIDYGVHFHHQTSGELKKIFGKGIDSPERLYYVYRNLIIALAKYSPSFKFSSKWYFHLFAKSTFQLMFAKDRFRRAKMISLGILHGLKRKKGKYKI